MPGLQTTMARIVKYLRDMLCVGVLLVQLSSADCPSMCKCANRKVGCSDRNLDLLPAFGSTLDRTVYVDLAKNSIRKLPTLGFAKLPRTQTIVLKFNKISTIQEGAFVNLTSLKTLDLTGNAISTLPRGIFNDLTSLHSLDLSQNYLRNLDGVLIGLSTLYRLDISHNYVTYLTDTVFTDLQGLMYLMIGNNQIKTVSLNAFSPISKLSYLVLKNNPLFNIDNRFANNRRMSYIDLTNCKLETIPQGLPWVLRYLQLSDNNITLVTKEAFKNYNYVGVIILDQNRIKSVEPGTFSKMHYLRELWLNGNKLSSVPELLPPRLEFLYLDANDITSLDKNLFSGLSGLLTFSVKGNKLTEVSKKDFDKMPNVTKLYLDNNNVTQISDFTFKSLGNLQRLFISRNPLTFMGRYSLYGLKNLRYLQMAFIVTEVKLAGNVFSEVPNLTKLELQYSSNLAKVMSASHAILKTLNNLTELNLMSAEMTTLSPILKIKLPKLAKLELADNKFHCDKNLLWLNHWMRLAKTLFVNKMDVKCFSPLRLKGKVISSMFDSQFVPVTKTTAQTTLPSTAVQTDALPTTRTEINVSPQTMSAMTTYAVTSPTLTAVSDAVHSRPDMAKTTVGTKGNPQYTTSKTASPRSTTVILRTRRFTDPMISTDANDYTTRSRGSPKWPGSESTTVTTTKQTRYRENTRTTKTRFTSSSVRNPRKPTRVKPYPNNGTEATTVTGDMVPSIPNSSVSVMELGVDGEKQDSESMNVVAIAVSVSVIAFLLILAVVGYVVYRCRQNRVIYHRAIHYQQHKDITYYTTLTNSETKPAKRPSRSERGSASSVTSEDITNQEGGVKFFHWDDDD